MRRAKNDAAAYEWCAASRYRTTQISLFAAVDPLWKGEQPDQLVEVSKNCAGGLEISRPASRFAARPLHRSNSVPSALAGRGSRRSCRKYHRDRRTHGLGAPPRRRQLNLSGRPEA